MNIKKIILISTLLTTSLTYAQQRATAVIYANQGKTIISKHIYGQFAEHLGHGIYGGIWVGKNSPIPNTNGVRNDVIKALKEIKIPNLRWPGGCFADEYHWMDGIGEPQKRPKMINTNWGGVVEDNSFGTHEFLNLCEELGTEPYICGNLGSGTVEEMSKWVEYMTFDGESPMANLRKENGREKPWKVKFFGVGNENWGCGGNMTPEFYADNYKRYASFIKNYKNNQVYKIAGGANSNDYRWTETLMKNIPNWMVNGISLHNYTFTHRWEDKGDATGFSEDDYFNLFDNGAKMDELITKHASIMDKYDPEKRISLVVDEWGAWYNVEPRTNPGFLFQQNTLRDALLAGNILNIFQKHAERIKMANIAQMVNVLQAIIFTDNEKMMLTPTYYVFDMYKVHQDATLLPMEIESPEYSRMGKTLKSISSSASIDKNGAIHVSFVNIDPQNDIEILCDINGGEVSKVTKGQIITGKTTGTYNTFEKPYEVKMEDFKKATFKKGKLTLEIPAKSLVTIELM
ncbi:Intracellular exo-alpha-L-arabinofuranosidase [uncultured Paludibacter sp.]|uniref:non-reducing end alpha-L-arabinofuranosidase n=1 Tax=uncultured Paludibacter sp. TaxID=497635 RepID=A0A653AHU7_9BACT|nr:Intracellular exo-alpha-L-arabinofuranosidase [uncultured Paludibacter sp.]